MIQCITKFGLVLPLAVLHASVVTVVVG